jgi:hypothetical protein
MAEGWGGTTNESAREREQRRRNAERDEELRDLRLRVAQLEQAARKAKKATGED